MAKLLLIHPTTRIQNADMGNTDSLGMPPLNLGYIAALTPDDWEIEIVDEYIDTLDVTKKVDLVGITATTSTAMRAYEICSLYKEKNIPIVMGGIHATLMPDEAVKYADAVVVGEAESVWGKVLNDVKNKKLKKKYVGERLSLNNIPQPRRDLFSDKYMMDTIQTTRGCPFDCDYCSITSMYGNIYRRRPVNDVLDELETLKKKIIYFIDDNFFGTGKAGEQRTIELAKGMIQRKIKKFWATQASLNIADHPEALKWAYKSGCRSIYVGIESIYANTLEQMKKVVNFKLSAIGMKKAIKTIQKHGIAVIGAFIFGNDTDNISVFKPTLDFMISSNINSVQIGILTPLPATKLKEKLEKENRIIYNNYPEDWDRYDTDHVTFKTKNISTIDLVRGFDYIAQSFFSKKNVRRVGIKTLLRTKSIVATLISYSINKDTINLFNFKKKFEEAARQKKTNGK